MNKKTHLLFWSLAYLILIVLFSGSLDSWVLSFYFVSFLLPVIIGTSLYFSEILVPRFLMTDRKGLFALRFFYLLVVSIYAELLVMLIAFVVLADYSIENLGEYAGDIRLLAIIMYLIVFGYGFMMAFMRLKSREERMRQLEEDQKKHKQETLTVIINRKQVLVPIDQIRFVESLSDYIKMHLEDSTLITRERISKMEENLPNQFLRIHRSFIVNKNFVQSFSGDSVTVGTKAISIGRKYKKGVIEVLTNYS